MEGNGNKDTQKSPIKIRLKAMKNGYQSIYLDCYHEGRRSYEYLKLYLLPETDDKAACQNAAAMRQAEAALKARLRELKKQPPVSKRLMPEKSTAKQPYPVGVVRAVQGDTAEPWRERPLRDRPAPGHHSRHGTRRHGTQGGRQGLLLVVHGIPENGLRDGKRPAPQIKNRVQPPMYLDNGTQCRSPRGCHPVQPDGPPLTPRTGEDEQREERVPDY